MELSLVTDLTESKMYRSKGQLNRYTARQVCDHAFMDLIAIWILLNEADSKNEAQSYAEKTIGFGRFNNFRQASTDLYLNIHVIAKKRTDLLASEDTNLLDKVFINERHVIKYLREASSNKLTKSTVRMILQRLEFSLQIENSNYRSVRRLAQNWPSLQTSQKRMVVTRMLFFYRANARRAEMYEHLNTLARRHGFDDPKAKDPEKKGVIGRAVAGAAAFGTGYAIGKRLAKALM